MGSRLVGVDGRLGKSACGVEPREMARTDGTNETNTAPKGVDQCSIDSMLDFSKTKILRVVCLTHHTTGLATRKRALSNEKHTCISDFLRGCTAMIVWFGSTAFFLPALCAGGYVSSVTFCAR